MPSFPLDFLGMTVISIQPIGLRARKKLRTREALVEAAFDLFRRQGFEATTIDEIAEQVELSPRTFFRYFASKEDVVLTLMEQQFAAVYEPLPRVPLTNRCSPRCGTRRSR